METNEMKQIADSVIQCIVCSRSIDTETLYQCVLCNDNKIYCEECGQFGHQRRMRSHTFSEPNIKPLKQLDGSQLEFYRNQGEKEVYKLLQLFHIESNEYARKLMFNSIANLMMGIQSGEAAAKACGIGTLDLAIDLSQSISVFSPITMGLAKSARNAAGFVTGLELCYISYKFWKGDIASWSDFGRLVTRSLVTGVGISIGNLVGYQAGFIIGASVGMSLGLVGSIIGSMIGGILGSMVAGIASGASAAQVFDKFWPSSEQEARKKLVREALKQFGYKETDIKNPEKFNKQQIKDRYKGLCLVHHPDRETGSTEAFQELAIHHGIVCALLDGSTNDQDNAVKIMIEAISLHKNSME